jgi:DNA processing protein
LALGIDSLAHRATIEAGGKTIAVLGSGLDWRSIYPSENKKLVESIVASGGAVLSELPCGMAPHKSNFPLRNRLISGLSLGTLVVEAGEKSGALITAQTALEQNREVLAVPGNIFSGTAMGVNNLIKAGARLVTSVNDVLETLNLTLIKEHVTMREVKPESPEEELILSLLSQEPLHIDQLILWSGLPSQVINSTLLMMEIKGKIKDVGGKRYVIK